LTPRFWHLALCTGLSNRCVPHIALAPSNRATAGELVPRWELASVIPASGRTRRNQRLRIHAGSWTKPRRSLQRSSILTVSCSRAVRFIMTNMTCRARPCVRFYNKRARAVRTGFIGPALDASGDQATSRRIKPVIARSRLKCVETSTGLGHNPGTNHFRLGP